MSVFISAYIWHLSQNGLPKSYIWPHLVRKACPSLTSDLILSERPSTHIWPCVTHRARMTQHLYPIMCKNITSKRLCTYIRTHRFRKAHHSHLTMCKHIAPEWISTYIRSCASTSHRKGSALTSNPILSERHNTYIQPCVNTSHQKGSQSQTEDSW